MENSPGPHGKWLNTVEAFYDQHDKKGGYQILFPCYRPDLCKSLAHHLGLNLYDFRQEKMQPLGWDANQITLHELTNTLLEKAANTGIVAHNIEALLATKSVQERVQWLTDFLAIDSAHSIILPLAIYQREAVEEHPRVCDIELEYFPEQSFISRLAM